MASKNSINTDYPIEIAAGGTDKQSFTPFAVIVGGTTSTGSLQSIDSVGGVGEALTSNGAGSKPSMQAFSSSTGSLVLLDSQTASTSSELEFTGSIDSTYDVYYMIFEKVRPTTSGDSFFLTVSEDSGSSYVSTGYFSGVNTINHASTASTNANVNNGAQFQLTPALSTSGVTYAIWLSNLPNGGQIAIMADGTLWNSSGMLRIASLMGYNSGSLTVDAVKITASSSTIASGTVYLYGLVQ